MDKFAEDKGHLIDIMRSIEEIQSYVGGASFEDFNKREDLRESVYYQLQTIGGASKLLSDEFKDKYRDIDWDTLYNLNFGGYNQQVEMDTNGVWHIITEELTNIHDQVVDLVTVLEDRDNDFMF
ncbi:hypothetical protein RCC89_01820 [Cytophagaceae bacterium ABcell3]|nr:hypothetical protein RCC89_01820 [Cytophagaceae bacterium ABcell3]